MADEYIVRGAKMWCSKGSNERKINLPVSHGSYVKSKECDTEKPILNSEDNTEENISYFGVCECSKCNDEIYVVPRGGGLKHGKKCQPELDEWQDTKIDYLVDGKPALTTESKMYTNCGGVITFVSSGQED